MKRLFHGCYPLARMDSGAVPVRCHKWITTSCGWDSGRARVARKLKCPMAKFAHHLADGNDDDPRVYGARPTKAKIAITIVR